LDDRGMNLVETRGTAPRAAILQGSPAPLCCPRASSWFRATLSATSAQRFHQISLRGVLRLAEPKLVEANVRLRALRERRLVRTGRIELPSLEWRSNIEPINYVRMLALAEPKPAIALRAPARQPSLASRAKAGGQGMDLNLRTPKGRRLQRRCFGRLHTCPKRSG
jgi:hypothetical protein